MPFEMNGEQNFLQNVLNVIALQPEPAKVEGGKLTKRR
jgi:hypothetical protein